MKLIAPVLVLAALTACGAPPSEAEGARWDHARPDNADRWLFAQAPATELGRPGDARFAMGQQILVLRRIEPEPIEPAPPPPPEPSIQVEVLGKEAKVTQTVEAEIFVKDAEPGRSYRLLLTPEHPSVRVLGPSEFVIEGNQKVRARFTSLADGRAAIRVTGFPVHDGREREPRIMETTR